MASYGVLGGIFDPIHYAHLAIASEALNRFNLDKVIFVPAGQPPHKKTYKTVTPEQRYLMTVIATASNPCFTVSRIEIDKPGPSYTVETMQELKATMRKEAIFYFIAGADALMELSEWREPEKIADYCSFIVATRPGYSLAELKKATTEFEAAGFPEIHVIDAPQIDISSSEIRERVKMGQPINYLVPAAVASYIQKESLYKT